MTRNDVRGKSGKEGERVVLPLFPSTSLRLNAASIVREQKARGSLEEEEVKRMGKKGRGTR